MKNEKVLLVLCMFDVFMLLIFCVVVLDGGKFVGMWMIVVLMFVFLRRD